MQTQTNIIREAFEQSWEASEESLPVADIARTLDRLIEARGEGALDALLQALQDESASVRAVALLRLGAMQDRRAVEPILRFIQDGSRYDLNYPNPLTLRERVALRLSRNLRDLYTNRRILERRFDLSRAACALGQIGSPDVVEPLQTLCQDSEPEIRNAANAALVRLQAS